MKSLFSLIILAIASETALSQWQWCNPTTQGDNLNDVWHINTTTFIAVGNDGNILRSSDAGETWVGNPSPTGEKIIGVQFLTDSVGFIGTIDGIFKTTDAGMTWAPWSTVYYVAAFHFQSEDSAYVIKNTPGGIEYSGYGYAERTTDGGSTWSESNGSYHFNAVTAASPSRAFAVGDLGVVYSTYNSGAGWSGWQDSTQHRMNCVAFRDSLFGFIGGNAGRLIRTTDGGITWTACTTPSPADIWKIVFRYDSTLFVANGEGTLWYSTDSGDHWILKQTSLHAALRSVHFSDSVHAVAVGDLGEMLRSSDAGATWSSATQSVTYEMLNGVAFVNPGRAIAVGNNGVVLQSVDSGLTWSAMPFPFSKNLNAISFSPSHAVGLIVGDSGAIFRTTDSAAHWTREISGVTASLLCASVHDDGTALASGNGGAGRFSDGGGPWTNFPPSIATDFYGVSLIGRDTAIFAGYQSILSTQDGGVHWNNSWSWPEAGDNFYFLGSASWGSAVCYVVGGYKNGYLYDGHMWFERSTDAGVTWSPFVVPTGMSVHPLMRGVVAMNDSVAYAVGDNGQVWVTVDRGTTWYPQSFATTNSMRAIAFAGTKLGVIVGEKGSIFRTTTGGYTSVPPPVSEARPGKFELLQNYPNPFNPTATIEYQITDASLVRLDVFDVLGRRVAELVNETKTPGAYSAVWNAEGAASGVYFYRLTTPTHSVTKKMTLVK